MVNLIITYANEPDSHFDFDYYVSTHLPLGMEHLSAFGLENWDAEQCSSSISGDEPAFHCISHLYFADEQEMRKGFAKHGAELRMDTPNYTNVAPVFTLAENTARSELIASR